MAELLRGDPTHADTSSIIIPSNPNLVLRGVLGQRLMALAGPMPQNTLLRMAPRPMGDVVHVATTSREGPVHWYVAVAFPFEPAMLDFTLIEQTLTQAVQQVVTEGQLPCAVPFFLDGLPADPDTVSAIAMLMSKVLAGNDFRVYADDPEIFAALEQVFSAPSPSVTESFVFEQVEGLEAQEPVMDESVADASEAVSLEAPSEVAEEPVEAGTASAEKRVSDRKVTGRGHRKKEA